MGAELQGCALGLERNLWAHGETRKQTTPKDRSFLFAAVAMELNVSFNPDDSREACAGHAMKESTM